MFCFKCGKPIEAKSKFCSYCGTKLDYKDKETIPREEKQEILKDAVKETVEEIKNKTKSIFLVSSNKIKALVKTTPPKKIIIIVVIILVFLLGISLIGNEEQQVKSLVKKSAKAWNEKDYHTMYEIMSPNYRKKASYEEFKEFVRKMAGLYSIMQIGQLEITDIDVNVKGDWAYVSYKIKSRGEVIDSTENDIFRKVNGKWHDVVTEKEVKWLDPGYNEEDLPPGYR